MPLKIIDAHIHFYDTQANQHEFLNTLDPVFTEIVGDYSKLPQKYLCHDYLNDTYSYQVDGVVWHEYLSNDPIKEAKWADFLARDQKLKQRMVALIDFLDPKLESKLEIYQTLPHVAAVREHLGWDPNNPLKRFAKRSDLLTDISWHKNLALLNNYQFKCGLEVFSHQLPDLAKIIKQYPNVGFTVAVMGWPLDTSHAGFHQWKKYLMAIASFPNVCFEISAVECIFGMNWTIEQIKPWILTAIEIFSTDRCMFGSHMPIAKLSRNFNELYAAYENIVASCTAQEKENLFYEVAATWFRF